MEIDALDFREPQQAGSSSQQILVDETSVRISSSVSGALPAQNGYEMADDQQSTSNAVATRSSLRWEPTTGYVYDVRMMAHADARDHPETPERIVRIHNLLKANQLLSEMLYIPVRLITRQEVLLVHSEDHWNKIESIQYMDQDQITESQSFYDQLSLYVNASTTMASKLSCGGVVEACLAVAEGKVRNAFAIVRPPGHHAEPDEHMGFCFFNNVAVATRVVQLQTKLQRIMILDWDVHHGNGTQRAFYDNASVLYVSLHRYEGGAYYPCGPFGAMESCGEDAGLGTSVNVPWPCGGMRDADYLYAFQKLIMPIAFEFSPDLVIVSAGFDAAEGDDLGECHVSPAGYAHMTHMLLSLASGRVVVALEGGYNLDSISVSARAVTEVLLGRPPPQLEPQTASEIGTETVYQCCLVQSKYWRSIDPKACEPGEAYQPVSLPLVELLKAHRTNYLATAHQMFEIPLVDARLHTFYQSQLFCTEDVFTNRTLVLFAHDFGNLRVELVNRESCEPNTERSYLIDATKSVISWIQTKQCSLIDLNIFPRPASSKGEIPSAKFSEEIMTYIWDNYIDLSECQEVVFLAFGTACSSMMYLVNHRAVREKVKAVIQVVGHETIPVTTKDNESIRSWYLKTSLVIIPANHRTLRDDLIRRRHGNILVSDERQPVKVFIAGFPDIKDFMEDRLPHLANLNGD
ncbi:histone deacetylase clr3 [Sistotremastrum suecicum HHB10207 ss-3]|uniref:histone deacetylase n=1 Tax=Sistotremastrum suecicum HHB10207 ss-3 TaxID=1314776 RepID=A0A166I9R0_9AGAM|nr:histone deacetylase clr3 [Sistotremastrum suecicum HHB10207 ss-3]